MHKYYKFNYSLLANNYFFCLPPAKLFQLKLLIGFLFFATFARVDLGATTVIPFENIAAMGTNGDAVILAKAEENFEVANGKTIRFRTRFSVLNNLKGPLSIGDFFALQSLRKKQGDIETIIAGDVEFEIGKTYLLFLVKKEYAPFWQPMMLSYGIHVEEELNNETYLVPSKGTLEMHTAKRPDGILPDPPTVFNAKALIQHLSDVFNKSTSWNLKAASSNLAPASFYPLDAAPSHCTYLTLQNGNRFRWTDFPDQAVTLYSEDDGDNDFSPASAVHGLIPDVVSNLETNYPGIDLNYQNTIDFTISDCTTGANGNDFQSFIGALGRRNTLIQYNDPCDEITNLSSCNGTLAIGGSYVSGTHTFDGQIWATQLWGFVIFNESVRTCNTEDEYKSIMIHELTHSLGIGHISSSNGAANMNPFCCSDITDLDKDCLNYTYPSMDNCNASPFSVNNNPIAADTYASDGILTSSGRIASGTNVDFEAETSITLQTNFVAEAGSTFSARIAACASLQSEEEPVTYRLSDGPIATIISPIATKSSFKIQPNPFNFNTHIAINLMEEETVSMAVYDLNGQLIKWAMQDELLGKGVHDINLDGGDFSDGMYYIVMQIGQEIQTQKMVVVK